MLNPDWFCNSGREAHLDNQWRNLIEIAEANPARLYYEVSYVWPQNACWAVGPHCKVCFLHALQFRAPRLDCNSFELNRLLAAPSHDERTSRPLDEVRVLS